MRMIIGFLVLVTLTGCTSLEQRKATFAQGIDIYVGKNADDLVLAKGPPTSTFTLSTGARVFEYLSTHTVIRGGGNFTSFQPVFVPNTAGGNWVQVPTQQSTPLSSYEYSCKILFKISRSNIVESWTAEGNGCY